MKETNVSDSQLAVTWMNLYIDITALPCREVPTRKEDEFISFSYQNLQKVSFKRRGNVYVISIQHVMKTRDGFERLRSSYCLVTNPITVNAWLLRRKEKQARISPTVQTELCAQAHVFPQAVEELNFPCGAGAYLETKKSFVS